MEWYYADGGQRVGPVNDAEFQTLCASGKIKPATLVWKAGMPEWQPLSAVNSSVSAPPPGALGVSAYCTQCGRHFAATDLLTFGAARVCAGCKETFFQHLREQGTGATGQGARYHYGGFWIRFLARIIDGLIISAVFMPIAFGLMIAVSPKIQPGSPPDPAALATFGPFLAVFGIMTAVELVAVALYEGWFTSKRGGTPGKLVLGLRVIRPNGDHLTFGRSIGRFFGYTLSAFTLYIGYIIAAFDSEKRSLHDRICDTRVIYKQT
jgi:uncharacterized RDD family membrane protein YckC